MLLVVLAVAVVAGITRAGFVGIGSSPAADRTLTALLPFDVALADLTPVEVTLKVNDRLFEKPRESPPTLRLDELTTVRVLPDGTEEPGPPVDLTLAPTVDTRWAVAAADGAADGAWEVQLGGCRSDCALRFVLTPERTAPEDDRGQLRVRGTLRATVTFVERGFLLGDDVPQEARLELAVPDARFGDVPASPADLGEATSGDEADPAATLVPALQLDMLDVGVDGALFTLTRTADAPASSDVAVDGTALGDTVTIVPLGDGPSIDVPAGGVTRLAPFDACAAPPAPCVRDFEVLGLDGELVLLVADGVRAEPGATRPPLLAGGDVLRATRSGTLDVRADGRRGLLHELRIELDVAELPLPPEVSVWLSIGRPAADGPATVQLGDAWRQLDADTAAVEIGTWLPGVFTRADGAATGRYVAMIPIQVRVMGNPGQDRSTTLTYELEVRVDAQALGRPDAAAVELERIGHDDG